MGIFRGIKNYFSDSSGGLAEAELEVAKHEYKKEMYNKGYTLVDGVYRNPNMVLVNNYLNLKYNGATTEQAEKATFGKRIIEMHMEELKTMVDTIRVIEYREKELKEVYGNKSIEQISIDVYKYIDSKLKSIKGSKIRFNNNVLTCVIENRYFENGLDIIVKVTVLYDTRTVQFKTEGCKELYLPRSNKRIPYNVNITSDIIRIKQAIDKLHSDLITV